MPVRPRHLCALFIVTGLTAFPGTASAKPYTEEEDGSARFSLLLRPKRDQPHEQLAYADELRQAGRRNRADKAYRALIKAWPRSPEAATAQFRHAEILREEGRREKAFDALQILFDEYTGRFDYEKALQLQFDIALDVMNIKRGKFLFYDGFKAPDRAIDLLTAVVKNGPRAPSAPEAQYLVGAIYEGERQHDLAIEAYLQTMLRYPRTSYAEDAAFARSRSLRALSDGNPYDRELAEDAWHATSMFITTYPDSAFAEEASAQAAVLHKRLAQRAWEVAVFYENKAHRPKAALLAYQSLVRRFPSSPWTDEAKERIQALQSITAGGDGE